MDTLAKINLLSQGSMFRQLVWDYQITPTDFVAMLEHRQSDWDYRWALARLLTRAPYYTTIKIINKSTLKEDWPQVRSKIKYQDIVKAYDFVVSR